MVKLVEPAYIIVTAFKTPSLVKYFQSNGILECYEKPIDYDTLV